MTKLVKLYAHFVVCVAAGYSLGRWLELMEADRLSGYRDKSALFGRELKPGEPPSWP